MKQISTNGIVLARTNYGEADRIITFLTPDNGKVRVMAKGVRRQKSKLAGGIELFSVSNITFIEGKGDLHTLVSTRLLTHFGNIVSDLERTMFGYEMLKITNRVLEDEGGEEFYELLSASLDTLNNLKSSKDLAEASFLLQLMRMLGHLPNLTHDNKGGELPKEGEFQFSFDDVAFFTMPRGPFTANNIKLLRLLSYNPAKTVMKINNLDKYLSELVPLIRQMSRQYVVSF